ncbi:phosphoribosylglycinamide formyltransferase-1 [Clostridium acetobutylicum]|uniref:Phosphoribosylglycinamide formyltransferase n=1 Tax=Clostridium acetobutylicum (strain ATCC 824 / DSM 792 / JCM 1419 / IAM 19013 / LMG 5710 / NBRC 13948 / NRRL B-527 / VKM B-1787 / 2291 / W) TaxID=272562 RepID=Q97J92_CLOAB|nr:MULTISPECIES: phosphoribosylglycinamide formyltransferase [Clostridium]AAK79362.1 Folate-dependent phosphoribosylglycinamide formyltransferase [Clostridium acetobutylicum ATCC 824]ADZ20446.1 phosphoribosylglycinamide formyltransferase [Clostridium acetobutylicum EA 2018]AEI33954.1 phosphoribosylglycinamide formyltransferase [Clostridium acetobutylicum DSM 1731]AWV81389.1 phosphoribosylglycinamide formyltransferase [Clostridium acetobutylicum]MBC2393023.1 phosphoribosylglycinamide formyltran
MYKIAVLVSGGGTDLQSIIDAIEEGYIKNCIIEAVISDKKGAFAIERAKKHGIKSYTFDRKEYKGTVCDEVLKLLYKKVDLIVLAGFLSILKGDLLNKFKNRIINIHPSLIPAFCGNGMYGMKVHEKAIEYGVKISGCTVHFVDEGTDSGPIILQSAVEVLATDTPDTLQKRVLEAEHKLLPEAVKVLSEGKVQIEGRHVKVIK